MSNNQSLGTVTVTALDKAIKQAKSHPQFVEWFGHLEGQIEQIGRGERSRGGKFLLWWMADVSGGCRQAMTPTTTEIEENI